MDAISRPLDFFLPKQHRWMPIDRSRTLDPEVQYVRIDTKITSIEILDGFNDLRGVWIARATDQDLSFCARLTSLRCISLDLPRFNSLSHLRGLPQLQALALEDPPTLSGLDTLVKLKCLVMRHFRRIQSLSVVETLSDLRVVSLSTIPSWDASRRCLKIESLEPLSKLCQLESLSLMGIMPLDRRLDFLESLADLKLLNISHVYDFRFEQYAALARALPNASGHCLQPYYRLPQLDLRCDRCGTEKVFLTGPRRRARRQLCPTCDAGKLAQHSQQWDEVLRRRLR